MKLNELLTEEELDEFIIPLAAIGTGKLIGAGARALGGLWRGSRTLPANVSRVPIPKIPGQVAAQRQAAQQYAGTWWNKIGFSKNSTVGKWRIDSMKKAIIRQGEKKSSSSYSEQYAGSYSSSRKTG